MRSRRIAPQEGTEFSNPSLVALLFGNRRIAPIWLVLRVYVGWQWLMASYAKLVGPSSIGWVRDGRAQGHALQHGYRLLQFWQQAAAQSQTGVPRAAYPWYRSFLLFLGQHHTQGWFVYLIAGSECLIGLCLVLGAFTAVATAGGAMLNFSYMLAGSASINPVLFAVEVLLLLAWRNAGAIGLDRWLLPMFGTPWQPGWLFRRVQGDSQTSGRSARDWRARRIRTFRRRARRRISAAAQ